MVPWCMCRWLEERLLAAALLVLLASAAAGEKCDLNIPHRPRQGQTLKLIKRDWASHQLVTEVAAILLEEILMYDVVRVNPDLGPVHDFRAISLGEADANFEVWQGGKEAQIEEWVRRGDAFVANSHSTVAASGLYTLKHTVDRYPEAAFYQYLQTPRLQWIFARQEVAGEAAADPNGLCADPEWNCTNFTWQPPACREHTMRCLGLVFHDYTHYTQGIGTSVIRAKADFAQFIPSSHKTSASSSICESSKEASNHFKSSRMRQFKTEGQPRAQ